MKVEFLRNENTLNMKYSPSAYTAGKVCCRLPRTCNNDFLPSFLQLIAGKLFSPSTKSKGEKNIILFFYYIMLHIYLQYHYFFVWHNKITKFT